MRISKKKTRNESPATARKKSPVGSATRKKPKPEITRKTRGQFAPGVSGNPGGRPKELFHVRELAQERTSEAIETLTQIMRTGTPDGARVRAAEALLDRAWGRSEQGIVLSEPKPKVDLADVRKRLGLE